MCVCVDVLRGLWELNSPVVHRAVPCRAVPCSDRYPDLMISASFFEIYGGQVYDLLNNRARLLVQEDGRQQVQVTGLTEFAMESVEEVGCSFVRSFVRS